jgi:8-oxo-dGTP pyrophosphatase MutT (NUDIX family)
MATKREFSAGGLAFRRSQGKLFFLLIKDHNGKWALPKGLVGDNHKGESAEEAALREVSEETGLPIKKLRIVEKLGDIKYVYTYKWDESRHPGIKKGDRIFKIVSLYLIESEIVKLKPQWEVQDAQWFGGDEAIAAVGYANTKAIVRKGVERARAIR